MGLFLGDRGRGGNKNKQESASLKLANMKTTTTLSKINV